MNQDEAMKEAKRRWEERAYVFHGAGTFLVGTYFDNGSSKDATGFSAISWEDAFTKAEDLALERKREEEAK